MKQILDVAGKPIDRIWAAEFRGFFLGEGSLEIQRVNHHFSSKGHKYFKLQYRIRVRLIQRDDSRAILDDIQARLGGYIGKHAARKMVSAGNGKTYTSNPSIVWSVSSKKDIQRVIDLLKNGVFTHCKLDEISAIEEYLAIMPSTGHKTTPETKAKQEELATRLSKLHLYRKGI